MSASMHPVVIEHQIIGTQTGKQGAGQVVPEDSVLCVKCGWMRCSDYTWHLSDVLAAGRAETTEARTDERRRIVAAIREQYGSPPSVLTKREAAVWCIGMARAHKIARDEA